MEFRISDVIFQLDILVQTFEEITENTTLRELKDYLINVLLEANIEKEDVED